MLQVILLGRAATPAPTAARAPILRLTPARTRPSA